MVLTPPVVAPLAPPQRLILAGLLRPDDELLVPVDGTPQWQPISDLVVDDIVVTFNIGEVSHELHPFALVYRRPAS